MNARDLASLALLWPLALLTAALLVVASAQHRNEHR